MILKMSILFVCLDEIQHHLELDTLGNGNWNMLEKQESTSYTNNTMILRFFF